MKARLVVLSTLGLGLGLALAACGKKGEQIPPAPTVTVAQPLQRQIVDWDDYVGQFVAVDSVDVRPRVTGYLQSVAFKDGQVVRKGQLLFVIDPRPYQALVDQSRAQVTRQQATLANASAQRRRAEPLLASHAIAPQDYETLAATEKQAAADLAAAQATLRTNLLNLGFTHVIAPMSGRISDRRVAPGNLVTQDQTVLTNIVNLDPIRFAFTGSEGAYLKYARQNAEGTRRSSRVAANPVEIRLQDEKAYRWRGQMEFVDNALDPNSGTIRGRAVIRNPDLFLTPGMFGHMRLLGSGRYPGLLLPDSAVQTDQNRQVVYVLDSRNIVHPKTVTTGPVIQGLRVVRSGLDVNDRVIIGGVQKAHAGKPVKPVPGQIELEAGQPDAGGYIEPAGTSAALADGR